MKEQKEKPLLSLQEQTLTRLVKLDQRRNNVRTFAWNVLVGWSGARRCWLAVDAVLSNVLNAQSPLNGAAREWLFAEPTPLLNAALLWRAQQSEVFPRILELIFEHGVNLTPGQRIIMTAMRNGMPYNLASLLETESSRWELFPPLNRPQLYQACAWTLQDQENKDIPALAKVLLADSELHVFTTVGRSVVLERLLETDTNLSLPSVSSCRDEVLAVLCREPGFGSNGWVYRHTDTKDRYVNNLFKLAEIFSQYLQELDPADEWNKKAVTTLLATRRNPVVWSMAKVLDLQSQDRSAFLSFLLDWYRSSPKTWEDYVLDSNTVRHIQHIAGEARPYIEGLNDADSVLLLQNTHIANIPGPDQYLDLARFLLNRVMKTNPATCREFLSPNLQSGEANDELVAWYIEQGVGTYMGDIQVWLNRHIFIHSMRTRAWLTIADYIVEHDLAAGDFLSATHYDDRRNEPPLLGRQYQLRPHDVDTGEKVKALLPHHVINRKYSPTKIWHNSQWRQVLLGCGQAVKECLGSILATAEATSSVTAAMDWLDRILVSELEVNAELQRNFIAMAWDPSIDSVPTYYARKLLIEDRRYERWLPEEHSVAIAKYLAHEGIRLYSQEREIATLFVPLEEQRRNFFKLALKERGYLPKPVGFDPIFQGEESRRRLTTWLVRHFGQIDTSDWIIWVEHFGLESDERCQRLLWRCLADTNCEEVEDTILFLLKI